MIYDSQKNDYYCFCRLVARSQRCGTFLFPGFEPVATAVSVGRRTLYYYSDGRQRESNVWLLPQDRSRRSTDVHSHHLLPHHPTPSCWILWKGKVSKIPERILVTRPSFYSTVGFFLC